MLSITLPPKSCHSLQISFLGQHLGESLQEPYKTKTYSSADYRSRESEKESMSDDECVKETHSLLREVHQAIFDEQVCFSFSFLFSFIVSLIFFIYTFLYCCLPQVLPLQVFDLVNREAFNSSLGVNVTGIRENYLQLSIGQGTSVFISLVPSSQGDQTAESLGSQNIENAILPLDSLEGVKLPEEEHDTPKKWGFPNRISYEIYLQQIFHEHILVKAKERQVFTRLQVSGQGAKDGSTLLDHFCLSLAHRIFSNKVLMELENVVQTNFFQILLNANFASYMVQHFLSKFS